MMNRLKLKTFVTESGNTLDSKKQFLDRLPKNVNQVDMANCHVILGFCPVISRVSTDIEAALKELRADAESQKYIILVVLHHTYDKAYVPDSRSVNYRDDKTYIVNVLYHEDGGLLKGCDLNTKALDQTVKYLKEIKDRIKEDKKKMEKPESKQKKGKAKKAEPKQKEEKNKRAESKQKEGKMEKAKTKQNEEKFKNQEENRTKAMSSVDHRHGPVINISAQDDGHVSAPVLMNSKVLGDIIIHNGLTDAEIKALLEGLKKSMPDMPAVIEDRDWNQILQESSLIKDKVSVLTEMVQLMGEVAFETCLALLQELKPGFAIPGTVSGWNPKEEKENADDKVQDMESEPSSPNENADKEEKHMTPEVQAAIPGTVDGLNPKEEKENANYMVPEPSSPIENVDKEEQHMTPEVDKEIQAIVSQKDKEGSEDVFETYVVGKRPIAPFIKQQIEKLFQCQKEHPC